MMDEIELKLVRIFKGVFPSLEQCDTEAVRQCAMNDSMDWDSMGHLNLLTVLEQEFGIIIGDDDALTLKTYWRVENYIRNVKEKRL